MVAFCAPSCFSSCIATSWPVSVLDILHHAPADSAVAIAGGHHR